MKTSCFPFKNNVTCIIWNVSGVTYEGRQLMYLPIIWNVYSTIVSLSTKYEKDDPISEVTYEGRWLKELLYSIQVYIEWIATPVAWLL